MNDNFKVTRALAGDSISGKIVAPGGTTVGTVIFKRGQIVNVKASTAAGKPGVFNPDVELALAANRRGFHLERDVIFGPIPFQNFLFDSDFLIPDMINSTTNIGYVSARKVQEFEVEGSDLIDAAIDNTTAIDTALTSKAGKIGLKGTTDELYAYLRGQLAVHDAANNCRLLVEVVG